MGQSHRDIYTPTDAEVRAMTSDAHYWYFKGIDNAEHDVTRFEAIAEGLKNGTDIEDLLKFELQSPLDQVSEANDNTMSIVSKNLMSHLYDWTRNPGWFDKIKIKSTIWFVKGRKDNKSYYLLNGAASWIDLRMKMFLNSIETHEAQTLRDDLDEITDKILTARDTVNDVGHIYGKGMDQIATLTADLGANLSIIQPLIADLHATIEIKKLEMLKTLQDAVNCIKERINKSN